MNNQESLEFIRKYFDELFGKRNVDALDVYLDKDYFDDDIADPDVDHIKNSKEYLLELFRKRPAIGVEVKETATRDGVIAAFLEWFVSENNVKRIINPSCHPGYRASKCNLSATDTCTCVPVQVFHRLARIFFGKFVRIRVIRGKNGQTAPSWA
jgi:hypothetical protein